MSTETVQRLLRGLDAGVEALAGPDEALAYLIEITQALAVNMANLVFLKLSTEAGWTPDQARGLAERALDAHAKSIAESVHANGGSMELSLQLGEAAFDAFQGRLSELAVSQGPGGLA